MRSLLATSIALVAVSSPVVAAPAVKPVIVLESHIGSRPAKLDQFLRQVDDMLETRGYAAFPASILRLAGNNIPRPGILDPDLTAAILAERHNDAFAKFKAAKWEDARKSLVEVRDLVRRNPALVANDIGTHDLMFRSMVALADCYKRLGDEKGAIEAMKDAIRVYSTRPVSRTDAWGPEGEALYLNATAELKGTARGRMTIAAGDPSAQIAIEGQQRGLGNLSLADLLPGVYRVFIRTSPQDPGRQYVVIVKPGEETFLNVDVKVDGLLLASEAYVGLVYPREGARTNDCAPASDLARRWTDSGAALVLATGEEKGRPVLFGIRCKDGIELRRATIYTDTLETNTPEKLVPFLDDFTADEKPQVQASATDSAPWWPTAVLGTSAAILLGSVVLYVASPADDHIQPTYDDKKTLAVEIYSGATVLASVGVYSWLTTSRHMSRRSAALYGAGAGLLLLGAMLIPTDQNEDVEPPGKQQRQFYRDTGLAGTIAVGVGVGCVVGGYLFTRNGDPTGVPTMTAANGGLSFGWAGSF